MDTQTLKSQFDTASKNYIDQYIAAYQHPYLDQYIDTFQNTEAQMRTIHGKCNQLNVNYQMKTKQNVEIKQQQQTQINAKKNQIKGSEFEKDNLNAAIINNQDFKIKITKQFLFNLFLSFLIFTLILFVIKIYQTQIKNQLNNIIQIAKQEIYYPIANVIPK
jgi:ATP-dependent Zn protease